MAGQYGRLELRPARLAIPALIRLAERADRLTIALRRDSLGHDPLLVSWTLSFSSGLDLAA